MSRGVHIMKNAGTYLICVPIYIWKSDKSELEINHSQPMVAHIHAIFVLWDPVQLLNAFQ